MKSKHIVEPDTNFNNNNIAIKNKQVISDIFSKGCKSNFSPSENQSKSESIQIFKIQNEKINPTNFKINNSSKIESMKIQNKVKNSTLHPSVVDVNISQRISKIEEKFAQFKIKNLPANTNLDSRIKSYNDASELAESNIVKNKSFLSNNF